VIRINRPFRVLVAANGVSVFGDYLNMIAFSLFAFAVTRSALATGLLLALKLAAALTAAPAAGRLATTGNRRVLLVASDLGQAALMFILAASVGSRTFETIALCAAAMMTGAGSTVGNVALRASIPVMVGDETRTRANSLMTASRSAAMALGFATAGVVVAGAGYRLAFIVNAVSFVVSAAVVAWLPLPLREATVRADPTATSQADKQASWWQRAPSILRLRSLAPIALSLVLIRGADAFGSASHNVGLPVYFINTHPQGAAKYFGAFWTAWAVGALAASAAVSRLVLARRREPGVRAFAFGTCLMSGSFVLAFVGWPLLTLLVVAIVAGAADGFTEISYTSALQSAPDDERGHLFGLSAIAERGGLGVGMLVAGGLITLMGTLATAAILHGVAIGLAIAFLLRYSWGRKTATSPAALRAVDAREGDG